MPRFGPPRAIIRAAVSAADESPPFAPRCRVRSVALGPWPWLGPPVSPGVALPYCPCPGPVPVGSSCSPRLPLRVALVRAVGPCGRSPAICGRGFEACFRPRNVHMPIGRRSCQPLRGSSSHNRNNRYIRVTSQAWPRHPNTPACPAPPATWPTPSGSPSHRPHASADRRRPHRSPSTGSSTPRHRPRSPVTPGTAPHHQPPPGRHQPRRTPRHRPRARAPSPSYGNMTRTPKCLTQTHGPTGTAPTPHPNTAHHHHGPTHHRPSTTHHTTNTPSPGPG